MHKKITGLVALALGFLSPADAQQPTKVARIGYLSTTDPATYAARVEGIRQALRERGYIEGQNIAMEYRFAERRSDREPGLAAELVRLKVDIIVSTGDVTIRAAKNATKTIPIVLMGKDPILLGQVSLKALLVPAGMSPASQTLTGN